jgi:hypothetical protein
MTEQELIQALRDLIAKASTDLPDARLLAREISGRDQQRIRLLAGLSIFFWLLAAAGLVILCIGLNSFLMYVRLAEPLPIRVQAGDMQKQPSDRDPHNSKAPPSESIAGQLERDFSERVRGTQLLHKSVWFIAGSVGALFLAALCTVLLITTSRRATLRQINLSLMELSEQVRQFRAGNPSEKVHKPESL